MMGVTRGYDWRGGDGRGSEEVRVGKKVKVGGEGEQWWLRES